MLWPLDVAELSGLSLMVDVSYLVCTFVGLFSVWNILYRDQALCFGVMIMSVKVIVIESKNCLHTSV